jgi:antitoxin Phd
MNRWPVQDAKAHFNDLLEACLRDGPQMLTTDGAETAVLVPIEEWRRLQGRTRPTLKELLLAEGARGDIPAHKRGQHGRRNPKSVD